MSNFAEVVSSLRSAFASGRSLPVEWRVRQLEGLLRMFRENETLLCEALHKDLRKSKHEALSTEVDFLKNDVIGALRHVREWAEPKPAEKTVQSLLDTTLQHPEPYGVVLVMGAWNYPLQLPMAPVTGAIAAGNCVLIKPSEISPHTAKVIEQLVPKYVDQECIKVVSGGIPETTELLKERFDYIFYTGSTAVGKIVREAANKYLTPTTLELGGKSPAYVSDSADLEITARRLVWGKTLNLGQTCIAPDYVLCSKATQPKLVAEMKKVVKEFFGDKQQASPDLSRIVSERHFDRLVGLMKTSKGKVEIGGNHDKSERFIDFTVMTGVSGEDGIMQEEIFGPLLPVVTAQSAEDAVAFINAREKPLALYVFTTDSRVQKLFTERTSSGGLCINDCIMHVVVESLPFGGVGHSGMGAYHGKASFDTFTHYKSVMVRNFGYLGEKLMSIRYPPYSEAKIPVMKALLKNRWLPKSAIFHYGLSFALGVITSAVGFFVGFRSKEHSQ